MDLQVGDYVQVIKAPDPWEGAGEGEEDRISLIGHVGIILELDCDATWEGITEAMVYVKIPTNSDNHLSYQRNIEIESLAFISRPTQALTEYCLENI